MQLRVMLISRSLGVKISPEGFAITFSTPLLQHFSPMRCNITVLKFKSIVDFHCFASFTPCSPFIAMTQTHEIESRFRP